ncbi:unnamed protein product [Bursaphelenchus okinawaensis]|uniref:Peptidase S8 pro-domain domain-containing protein n=1 Tax=Bursaphelenchus okinawaensis TaxID=465554 RepID=A0A811JU61_9BILA|nr:unnamed protein product [Bursaphelenchus okinawaensis]CAG9083962.1 unnamed protein product [Bursaphelenchus okinawaensis]
MADQVTLKLKEADDNKAKEVAELYGFEVKGESFMESHYFLHYSNPSLTVEQKQTQLEQLNSDPFVHWAKSTSPKSV